MKKWALAGIIILGFILRVVALNRFPVGFTPDEASFGYDAYSLLQTGKDQWGNTFPVVLKSFGDFKAPLYSYLAVPFVALLGLTKEAVRLPNVLVGIGAILVTYLVVKKLTDEKIGLMAAFLLAISSWHIMMSRGAFEANLTTFFIPLKHILMKNVTLSEMSFGVVFVSGIMSPTLIVFFSNTCCSWSGFFLFYNSYFFHFL